MTESNNLTNDTLLDGKVKLMQPANGYRAAIDPVLLAAAVPARAGDQVLDIGCGAGAASMCLGKRVAGCLMTGLEIQPEMAELAKHNAVLNDLGQWFKIYLGDLLEPPPGMQPGTFDHVMLNPPFMEPGKARISPNILKETANIEGAAGLLDWVNFAYQMLGPKGSVAMIHRADRLDDVIGSLAPGFGGLTLIPLWPKAGKEAKRIIVIAQKNSKSPAIMSPGLVLHDEEDGYTDAALRILRDGEALEI